MVQLKQQCIHSILHYMIYMLIQMVTQLQHGYVLNYQTYIQLQVNNGTLVSMIQPTIQVGHIIMNM